MFERAVSAALILFMSVTSIFFFAGAVLIWAATYFFDRKLVLLHLYSSFWASLYVWVMPAWRVKYYGRDNIRNQTYVIVSNHQSLLDILVAFGLFFPFKWVSKIEMFNLPFIGWNMRLNRYIAIRRGARESIEDMMKAAEAHLLNGSSVYFFPEGTRSFTSEVKPFKLGAFALAKRLRLPVLPIAINGTTHALPKNSLKFHGRHDITVCVLPAIEPDQFDALSAQELANLARRAIADNVGD